MTDEAILNREQLSRGVHDDNRLAFAHYQICELGVITGLNGRFAEVTTFRYTEDTPVRFDNIEVLYPGYTIGAITGPLEGSLCILIVPLTAVADTSQNRVYYGSMPYDTAGMKAIPITNGENTTLQTGFDESGNFIIDGNQVTSRWEEDAFTLSFGTSCIELLNDGTCTYIEGTFYKHTWDNTCVRDIYFNTDGKASKMITHLGDGSYTVKKNATEAFAPEDYEDLDAFDKWLWVEQYNADGSLSKVLQEDVDTPLLTREVATDGSVTDTLSKDSGMVYTLNVGDNVSIVVDGSAKSITFTTGNTTEEKKDGGWSIKVNGPITLESTTADIITVKNSLTDLKTVIKDIVDVLNNGSCATAGSPAAHTITAGQFSQAVLDLGNLMGQ